MISRKRELESAILAAFETWAGASLPTGTVLRTARRYQTHDSGEVLVACNRQSPDGSMEEYNVFTVIEGAIVCSALVTDGAPSAIEALEILAENFIEQDTDTLVNAINAETSDILVLDIQPGEYEDGIETDTKRYIARYTFSATVRDITT